MKVLIGVDPHKASVALAVVDEASGELLERATFPQNRAGLRSLERWAARYPERRSRRWRTPAASVGTWRAGWQRPASPWWTSRPSFRHGSGCSLFAGNARKNDGLDALATALAASRNERLAAVDPEADSEVLRLLSERRD